VQKGDEHGIETYRVGERVSSDDVEVVDTLYRRLSLVDRRFGTSAVA
jgi:hypothetical protein